MARNRYRFYILSDSFGNQQVRYAPINWNENGYSYKRSPIYKGVVRKFTIDVLQFPKDGKQILQDIFDAEGIEAKAQLLVQLYNPSTYAWDDFFTGDIDFSTYAREKLFVEVTALDSSFEDKVKNREGINVSLTGLTSLDGGEITGFTNEGVQFVLPARNTELTDLLSLNSSLTFQVTYAIPFILNSSESGNSKTVSDPTAPAAAGGAFYVSDAGGDTINMTGNIIIPVTITGDISVDIKRYNSGAALQETINLLSVVGNTGLYTISIIGFDEGMICSAADFVNLVVTLTPSAGTPQTESSNSANVTVKTVSESIAETNATGVLIYEAFMRILQTITNKIGIDYPFYSDYLGRTDSDPDTYGSDGDGALAVVTSGEMLRGLSIATYPITANLKDLFQDIAFKYQLGAGFETIGGVKKFRVEPLLHFFNDDIVLTFDNVRDIRNEVAVDWIWNKIETGYTKFQSYEEIQGIEEYNNKSEWASPISVLQNTLSLVSKYRADNAGIQFARESSLATTPTSDTKYDGNNWLINVVRGTEKIDNGRFNTWTVNDQTPDDWTLTGATVQKETILGNFRCQFTNATGNINQTWAITSGDRVQIGLSYLLIHATDTSTHAIEIQVIVDGTHYLTADMSWSAVVSTIVIDTITPTKLAEVQSFLSYSKITDASPATGNLVFKILATDIIGLTVDNVTNSAGQYTARTNQGFDDVENTVDDDGSYNLFWTPARILRNNYLYIRGFLEKHLSKSIMFTKSEKNNRVVTEITGEDTITENEDVVINDFDNPIWEAVTYKFESPVDTDVIATLESTVDSRPATYGIIKFRENTNDTYKYGWIISIEVKNKKGKSVGEFELLKVNETYVTPV